jgi:hypothetical protein
MPPGSPCCRLAPTGILSSIHILHYNTTLALVQARAALNRRAERTKPPSGAGIQPAGLRSFSAGSSAPRPLYEEGQMYTVPIHDGHRPSLKGRMDAIVNGGHVDDSRGLGQIAVYAYLEGDGD